jgi:hypothetical protein
VEPEGDLNLLVLTQQSIQRQFVSLPKWVPLPIVVRAIVLVPSLWEREPEAGSCQKARTSQEFGIREDNR